MRRYPWLKLIKKSRPEPELEPPFWLGNHSNGEYFHDQTPRDRMLRQLILDPNQNIYAEIGGVWNQIMTDPTVAAHVIGKLLLYVGQDNLLWGSDAIWTSSAGGSALSRRGRRGPGTGLGRGSRRSRGAVA